MCSESPEFHQPAQVLEGKPPLDGVDIVDIPEELVPWLRQQRAYVTLPELEARYEARCSTAKHAKQLEDETKVRGELRAKRANSAELLEAQRDQALLEQMMYDLRQKDLAVLEQAAVEREEARVRALETLKARRLALQARRTSRQSSYGPEDVGGAASPTETSVMAPDVHGTKSSSRRSRRKSETRESPSHQKPKLERCVIWPHLALCQCCLDSAPLDSAELASTSQFRFFFSSSGFMIGTQMPSWTSATRRQT